MSNGSNHHGAAPRYAVVGGGVSGMAAAWQLARAGVDVELLERDDRLGGRSQSGPLADHEITFGGKNIGRRYTLFREFVASLGDHRYEQFGINASPIVDGRLRTFDSERRMRGFAQFAGQARPRDVARVLPLAARVLREEDNRYLGSPYFSRLGERRDDRPLASYFSRSFASSVLRPMTCRMNGAEPDEVYLGNVGTNLGMVMDTFDQLVDGMGAVVRDFVATHRVRTGVEVLGLARDDAGRVRGVRVRGEAGPEVLPYDGVVLAVPAHAAARLVREHDAELGAALASVRYFPAGVVLAEYDRPVFTEQVRGVVFPAGEPISNAGAYGVDERHVARYTFSGRAARVHLGEGADPEQLLDVAERRLAPHSPVEGARRRDFVFRQWEQGYCAYTPRYGSWRGRVERALGRMPGVYLTGDYLRGASIEACFRAARDCTERVAADAGLRASAGEVTVGATA